MAPNAVARFALGVVIALFISTAMHARDLGQWDDPANAELKKWYQDLKQPDNPVASCCGEADAYWADSFETTPDGDYVAIITDPRDDAPLRRIHRAIGTRIVVPKNKIKWDEGNPTGHGLIFLNHGDYVFCYLPPLGI
ncbi:hypothetical protein [Bradyrhizobium canariense]|uniref:Uncharacterized protein n=1 Tax=Bradyrhizobium canariense TaxID=255045 RepID=A0A1H1ZNZ5_9BRAD|nr:hypothetical protein [Bradyrhizobium canariense]SDT34946.1 hypothetical protein SAMN05444158_5548 [Bradyrhizobium canariense]